MTNIKLKKYKLKYNDIMRKALWIPDNKILITLGLIITLFLTSLVNCSGQNKQPYKQNGDIKLDTLYNPNLQEGQEFLINIKMYKEGNKLHLKDNFNVEFDRQWMIEMLVGYLEQVYNKLEEEKQAKENLNIIPAPKTKSKTEKLNP